MTTESAFIESLRALATHPAARGLLDDAAVLEIGRPHPRPHPRHARRGRPLPPRRSARRRRLEARRGEPLRSRRQGRSAARACCSATASARTTGTGPSSRASERRSAPSASPCSAATRFAAPGARTLALTAIGEADGPVPSRAGRAARRPSLGQRHDRRFRRRPARPRRGAGRALPQSAAAARGGGKAGAAGRRDDGRFRRAADRRVAPGRGERRRGRDRPCPGPAVGSLLAALGDGREARLAAATAGDDYELLFAAAAERAAEILALQDELGLPLSRIGILTEGAGLSLTEAARRCRCRPARLGTSLKAQVEPALVLPMF